MIAITVELLHGTIRAASASDLALTDQEDPGDWPPSPARLFSALVAADGTRDRSRVTDGSELQVLAAATPPTIFASPGSEVIPSPLNPRYVVKPARVKPKAEGLHQEYPARSSELVNPGTRLSPKSPDITYVWNDIEPTEPLVKALERRAARVGYVGCSDSPARLRVHSSIEDVDLAQTWEPDESGSHDIPVPFPGLVEVLDTMYDAFGRGEPVRRSWYPVKRARYRSPDDPAPAEDSRWSEVLWLRLSSPIPGRFVLRVTESLKAAVLKLYETHVADVPKELHGHGFDGQTGYQLVHWLGLPEVGYEHARGRLHGLAIAVPQGIDTATINGLHAAVSHLKTLTVAGRPPVEVAPFAGEPKPWSAHPRRWRASSRRWISASPVVHERRVKGEINIGHVAGWCLNSGIRTRVVDFRLSPVPLAHGALSLRPHEVFHSARGRRPFSHLEVLFEEDVEGPVVLGRARQLGIGLMAPVLEGR